MRRACSKTSTGPKNWGTALSGLSPWSGSKSLTSAEAQHKVECGLLLDVVVRKCPAILKLLAGEDHPLLVRRNSFLVLDLGLDIVNGVRCLDVQGEA